jgi:hypothetical protein
MPQAEISGISSFSYREPCTVIAFVLPRPAGFEITFQGPALTTFSSAPTDKNRLRVTCLRFAGWVTLAQYHQR